MQRAAAAIKRCHYAALRDQPPFCRCCKTRFCCCVECGQAEVYAFESTAACAEASVLRTEEVREAACYGAFDLSHHLWQKLFHHCRLGFISLRRHVKLSLRSRSVFLVLTPAHGIQPCARHLHARSCFFKRHDRFL